MKDKLIKRISELLKKGDELINSVPYTSNSKMGFWVEGDELHIYQKWMTSVINVVNYIDKPNGIFIRQINKTMENENLVSGIPVKVILNLHGILASILDEMYAGLLDRVEDIIISEAFDNFLEYAIKFHKGGKKKESSILASAVLEDTINSIAIKNNLDTNGVSLEPLVDELIKNDVITTVKGKRIKGFIGIRNHAFHAEWDKYDIQDVGKMIAGIRELLEHYPDY